MKDASDHKKWYMIGREVGQGEPHEVISNPISSGTNEKLARGVMRKRGLEAYICPQTNRLPLREILSLLTSPTSLNFSSHPPPDLPFPP